MKLLINSEAGISGDYISNDEMTITGTNLTFETVPEPIEPPPPVVYPPVVLFAEFIFPEGKSYTSEYPEIRVGKNAPVISEGPRWQEGLELGRLFPAKRIEP